MFVVLMVYGAGRRKLSKKKKKDNFARGLRLRGERVRERL